MIDKVQKIREEVEIVVNRRLNLLNGDYFDLNKEADGFTNEIMDIIYSLQEEPVSKDLEKAAEEWDESLYRSDAFKAGTKWKEEQIMKDAIDATVFCESLKIPTIGQFLHKTNLKENDKVKVIIIKSE